jgi:bile acid:Na+ symporter, BASS family
MSINAIKTKFLAYTVTVIILLLLAGINPLHAKIYHKILKDISVGMDSTQVLDIAGAPSKTINVERWFYANDQVVISNNEVVDIRIKQRIKPEKSRRDKKQINIRSISLLRIGMNPSEVLSLAGAPDSQIDGIDLYFTNRHRIELIDGKVSAVEMHIKQGLEILDWIRLNFSKGGLLFMNITIAFIMFGVALEIKVRHFKDVLVKPKSAIIGVVSQFIALPALTFLLVLIIKPSPSVAMGMILVAACPGGNVSNFISSLAKGNVELSVSLTAIATLSAIFMTPLNFALWGGLYSGTADMVIPIKIDAWEMMKTVLILLGIPIVLGIFFSSKFPEFSKKIVKPFKIFSILIFSSYIIGALASNFNFFLAYIHLIILIVFVHNLLALITGFSLSTLFKLPNADRRSLTIETGIQNSGLALVLIFNPNLFDGLGGMAFVAAWWGIWHILAGLGIAFYWSRKPIHNP